MVASTRRLIATLGVTLVLVAVLTGLWLLPRRELQPIRRTVFELDVPPGDGSVSNSPPKAPRESSPAD